MPTVWLSLKRSLQCQSEASDVDNPKTSSRKQLSSVLTKKAGGGGGSGCFRSIANLKDVIHGSSKRHSENPVSCSPRSIGSSEFVNPITHQVILSNSRCELKITSFDGDGCDNSTYVATLSPGTPGPGPGGHHPTLHYFNHHPSFRNSATPPRKTTARCANLGGGVNGIPPKPRASLETQTNGNGSSAVTCHKWGEQFGKWEALEAHHLSKHAVTELVEGDSSRKIVEIICRSSWLKSENQPLWSN